MDDRNMIALLKNDVEQGARILLDKYTGFVYSIASMRLSNYCDTSEIEDCVAETLNDFILSVSKFDPEKCSIKTYIGVMARNNAVSFLRSKKPSVSIESEEIFFDIPSNDDTANSAAVNIEISEIMEEIKKLGPPDSFIILRKYYFGQPTKELAKELKMSPNSVDVRAHRALEKLRKLLGGKMS